MCTATAQALVERALLLTKLQDGTTKPAPTLTTLLDEQSLAELTPQAVLRAVIALGRTVVSRWAQAYPEQEGPQLAIAAAEAWAVTPSADAAEQAAKAADLAIKQAIVVWHGPHKRAAWAGRTAAWVAMAPRYDWPAVAALFGACQAIGKEQVVEALAAALPNN